MKTDWRLIALLYIVGLLAAAQFAKIALMLGVLAEIYPGAPLSLAVSGLSVAGILLGVTAGMVVARIGPRRALLWALGAGAVFSFVQSGLPTFGVLMLLRVLEGGTHLILVVAAPTLMAAISAPRDKPVSMGLWGTFFGIGFAVSAALVPLFDEPSNLFIVHGAAMLVMAFVLRPLLPRGVTPNVEAGNWLARHVAIYSNPRIVAPALGFLWHTLMFLGLLTFLPQFLGTWTAPTLPLAALVGTFGAGVLARHIAPRNLLIWAFILSIGGLLVALVVPHGVQVWLIVFLFVILGVVPGASFANVPALNADPADQARANGAIAQLGNVGTASSTPLFAAAIAFGLGGALIAAALICIFGLGAVWLIHRQIAKSA